MPRAPQRANQLKSAPTLPPRHSKFNIGGAQKDARAGIFLSTGLSLRDNGPHGSRSRADHHHDRIAQRGNLRGSPRRRRAPAAAQMRARRRPARRGARWWRRRTRSRDCCAAAGRRPAKDGRSESNRRTSWQPGCASGEDRAAVEGVGISSYSNASAWHHITSNQALRFDI
jgi:hypothetical protein